MLNYLLAGVAVATVLAIILVIRDILERRRAYWEQRWQKPPDDDTGMTLTQLASRKPSGWSERMDLAFQAMILRTGLPLTSGQAIGAMMLTGAVLGAALVLWREDYYLLGVGLLAGILLPFLYFLFMQARWRQRLQEQLPDAFFLLARSMRAGLSLEQAITLVGDQGREVGGNLAMLLDRVATATRDRNQFRGQFQASTALGRTTGLFISLGAPALLLIYLMLQPDYLIKFAQNPAGMAALAVAAVLQIIGVTWIFYLLRVDY
jgi:Flp pilus assembly protein TadB